MLRSITEEELDDARGMFSQQAPFRESNVATLAPPIFGCYARIFHPALHVSTPDHTHKWRWDQVAMKTNRYAHALMQWKSLVAPDPLFNTMYQPDEGTIPYAVSLPLRRLLASTSHDQCYLAVWRGFGLDYQSYIPRTLGLEPEFGLGRDYDLFAGPVTMLDIPFYPDQTANHIWASDQSWWLCTDIDLNTTYIGGSEQLIDSLLSSEELEVWPAHPHDDVSENSDRINV